MAGKSNKGKNRKAPQSAAPNPPQQAVLSDAPVIEVSSPSATSVGETVVAETCIAETVVAETSIAETVVAETSIAETVASVPNGVTSAVESDDPKANLAESETTDSVDPPKQGELHLYPVPVKTLGGEKLELQPHLHLNPGDSVMDVRQFLLDAPETCYFTCYDLLLYTKDGLTHHLEDYNEISEVADITAGECSLEMVPATYDDRSMRAHVHRTRELLSLSTLHASLSTSLAMQHETGQTSLDSTRGKAEFPELDGLGFMEDVSGSLSKLLSPSSQEIKCVENIVFSSFNPPPGYRRLVGDLIYLDVVTLEGGKFCITGTTRTFYVNSSTANVLDPRPAKNAHEATTLVGLLNKISAKFKKAFREILERKASAHPFENVQSILPPNMWLGIHPVPDHKRDAARAENALTLTYGSELIGMQRDWNEELQSCREFPRTSPQERILRDRALYKVTSDFVDAAINGAIGVINRCIPPINPTDPECFHMYVHNNIFFSFAVDADLEQLSGKQTKDINFKTNNVNLRNATEALEQTNGTIDTTSSGVAGGSNVEEVNGGVELTSNVSADTQLADSEQATYASANNDLKGTKAFQEADVPGLYNLAMAIIDYRGYRVVAQSVLPGILQGDKSDSLLYGSVDNGKKICWNEDFHSKVVEAAKRLHLKEHKVLDGSGNEFKLAGPVECKGIVGSDDRHYLLDLMRVTPRDANYVGPGSRFCILRPELITAFCHAEAAERLQRTSKSEVNVTEASKSSEDPNFDLQETDVQAVASNAEEVVKAVGDKLVEEHASVKGQNNEPCDQLCFSPNVLTDFKLAGSPEEIAEDEENVRKATSYLTNVVLPKFTQDLCTLEVSPMDGQTLTEALHAHGINIRYIGKIAEGTKHLPHLWELCTSEISVRGAKHVLKGLLRETEDHDVGPAIAHFLNCFFGNCQAAATKIGNGKIGNGKSSRGKGKLRNGISTKKTSASYMGMTSDSLWHEISGFARLKYQFELPDDARSGVKKVSVIRNLSQKVGISVAARNYDLDSTTPFQIADLFNIQPVVKHSIPVSSEAKDLVETGKVQLAEGMLSEAYTMFSEAFSILQQVTGPMHREVANCCRYLAMVLYHAGDMAGAIMQQHKELIINERCLGLDHPDTAHSYGNMALFYHGLNQTELALRHMSRALLLLGLSSGPDHPDVAATFINVAMMYQDIGKMDTALRYLQEALKKNERLLGEEHIQTAVCYHALAIAFNCMGAFKLSHQHEKKTYDILVKQLGEEDSRTRDSENWMKTFKIREINAQKVKGQALNASSAQKAIDIIKAHPDLIQAFQAAAAGSSGNPAGSVNKSLNAAALMGDAGLPPRAGRGVDERAARAAAEVRKKAAARGLLIRPHGVPVQALPPLTQLLNVINSGASPDEPEQPVNGTSAEQQSQAAPVGLGAGLASLDSKKQKTAKPKA
ncbi:hypothetical protein V2J09_023287 [Rumex salicifolius]